MRSLRLRALFSLVNIAHLADSNLFALCVRQDKLVMNSPSHKKFGSALRRALQFNGPEINHVDNDKLFFTADNKNVKIRGKNYHSFRLGRPIM